MPAAKRNLPFNVLKTGHVELRVTDLERATEFYIQLLGLTETERRGDRVFLRCIEDWEHHSLILRQAESPGVAHIGYRVESEQDLEALFTLARQRGLSWDEVASRCEALIG